MVHIAIALPDHHARLGVAWRNVVEQGARLAANGHPRESARTREIGAREAWRILRRSVQRGDRSERVLDEGHHG